MFHQNPEKPGRRLPKPVYANIKPPAAYSTRAGEGMFCQCTTCCIVRENVKPGNITLFGNGKGLPPEYFQLLFPNDVQPLQMSDRAPKTTKRCDKCGCVIGKGRAHKCNEQSARGNTMGLIRNLSLKSKERTARDTLLDIFEEKGINKNLGAKTSLSTGGKKVNIVYGGGPSKGVAKKRRFTAASLQKIQLALDLSDRKLK